MNIGDQVVVSDPEGFVAEVRNKIKNGRVGEIVKMDDADYALVCFPAVGRRKQFRHHFRVKLLEAAPAADITPPAAAPARRM